MVAMQSLCPCARSAFSCGVPHPPPPLPRSSWHGAQSVGLTDALLRPSGGIERDAAAQYPVVWVEDAARMYAVIVRKLLFPTPEDQAGPDVRGKVFHACGDPLSDALTWEHIRSGETQVGTPPAARAKVRGTPLATAIKVARINEWLGHKLGWMPFGKTTTYANVFFGSLNYPCEWRARVRGVKRPGQSMHATPHCDVLGPAC